MPEREMNWTSATEDQWRGYVAANLQQIAASSVDNKADHEVIKKQLDLVVGDVVGLKARAGVISGIVSFIIAIAGIVVSFFGFKS